MNRTAILSDYIDRVGRQPFQWGVNDGLTMVAGAVELLTEVDHAAPFRGRYSSCAEGKRLIGMTPLRFIGARAKAIHPIKAVDGDIAGIKQGREYAFGIFIGALIYTMTTAGIGILPRSAAVRAFEVL